MLYGEQKRAPKGSSADSWDRHEHCNLTVAYLMCLLQVAALHERLREMWVVPHTCSDSADTLQTHAQAQHRPCRCSAIRLCSTDRTGRIGGHLPAVTQKKVPVTRCCVEHNKISAK